MDHDNYGSPYERVRNRMGHDHDDDALSGQQVIASLLVGNMIENKSEDFIKELSASVARAINNNQLKPHDNSMRGMPDYIKEANKSNKEVVDDFGVVLYDFITKFKKSTGEVNDKIESVGGSFIEKSGFMAAIDRGVIDVDGDLPDEKTFMEKMGKVVGSLIGSKTSTIDERRQLAASTIHKEAEKKAAFSMDDTPLEHEKRKIRELSSRIDAGDDIDLKGMTKEEYLQKAEKGLVQFNRHKALKNVDPNTMSDDLKNYHLKTKIDLGVATDSELMRVDLERGKSGSFEPIDREKNQIEQYRKELAEGKHDTGGVSHDEALDKFAKALPIENILKAFKMLDPTANLDTQKQLLYQLQQIKGITPQTTVEQPIPNVTQPISTIVPSATETVDNLSLSEQQSINDVDELTKSIVSLENKISESKLLGSDGKVELESVSISNLTIDNMTTPENGNSSNGTTESSKSSISDLVPDLPSSSKGLGKLSKVAKGGIGGLVGGLALDYASGVAADSGHEKTAATLDVASDALTGASTGAMIGSVIPGVGTAIGGAAGGLIGVAGEDVIDGQPLSKKQAQAVELSKSMGNTIDPKVQQSYDLAKDTSADTTYNDYNAAKTEQDNLKMEESTQKQSNTIINAPTSINSSSSPSASPSNVRPTKSSYERFVDRVFTAV